MSEYFDTLETRDPAARERDLLARLPAQIAHAKAHAPWFAESLADIDPAAIDTRSALAQLPVLRKHTLIARQKTHPPFGGLVAAGFGPLGRIFASPGPIYEPEGRTTDYWRSARALFAAGVRAGDRVHNSFSYHMTPGAWILDAGARALGCAVFPGGVGQTEQQVQAMADLQPQAYVGTPSFLRILLDKADELGVVISSLTKALVSGEAFLPAQRAAFTARGIAGFQAYATADLGVIAYETVAHEGLVVDEDILLEIVRPGSGEPVSPGEVGEVVVTTFNPVYPLIRFGTGDLSAELSGPSPCGRTNRRIKGWMGRADQTVKMRGMFVHPEQIEAVRQRHAGLGRVRLVVHHVDAADAMTLECEGQGDADAIAATLRELTKLRGEVRFVDTLPNDGKVISDERRFD